MNRNIPVFILVALLAIQCSLAFAKHEEDADALDGPVPGSSFRTFSDYDAAVALCETAMGRAPQLMAVLKVRVGSSAPFRDGWVDSQAIEGAHGGFYAVVYDGGGQVRAHLVSRQVALIFQSGTTREFMNAALESLGMNAQFRNTTPSFIVSMNAPMRLLLIQEGLSDSAMSFPSLLAQLATLPELLGIELQAIENIGPR